ncbi:N-formylglutamate amidohydrolase [Streptomyces sp. SDT5-1]|uniref:N-formylglutamate amidohydrolase n=1 Tax=Streptomyces sp. SDT5-1 TaxID=3406418 RepID=UPI003FD0103E
MAPVVFDVSRSGREYPCDFRSPLPFTTVHDNASMYVDELFAAAPSYGATLLHASFPNTYIDTNRSEQDIDPALIDGTWPGPIAQSGWTERGLGLLKRLSRYGEDFHEGKLPVVDVQHRIEHYHRPYHQELGRIIDSLHRRFGAVWQLTCHCMSAVGAPTHADPGQQRADFCLGDMDGTTSSPDFTKFVEETLTDLGFSVSVNFPYPGGELTTRHANPNMHINSVMIEVNKRLFMDVKTFKKTSDFDAVQEAVETLIEKITANSQSLTTSTQKESR